GATLLLRARPALLAVPRARTCAFVSFSGLLGSPSFIALAVLQEVCEVIPGDGLQHSLLSRLRPAEAGGRTHQKRRDVEVTPAEALGSSDSEIAEWIGHVTRRHHGPEVHYLTEDTVLPPLKASGAREMLFVLLIPSLFEGHSGSSCCGGQ